jgi:hypothetical protein
MLSPSLIALNRDAFVLEDEDVSTVDLTAHRAASDLDALAFDEKAADAA